MNKYAQIALSFVTSFLVTAGGAIATAATGSTITTQMIVIAVALGLANGAKAVQDLMKVPPP